MSLARSRRAIAWRVILLCTFIGFSPGSWSLHRPAVADAQGIGPAAVADDVRERVHREGVARVIVELRLPTPHVAEGLLSPAGVIAQREAIRRAGSQVVSALHGRSHRLVHQLATVPLMVLEIGPDALPELDTSAHVRRVELDSLNYPLLPQSVPLVEGDRAASRGYDGTGVMVAIVDTGIDTSHPFFGGRVVEEACFSTTSGGVSQSLCPSGHSSQIGAGAGVNCPTTGPSAIASCFHGTHVAGIAAGNGATAGQTFSGVAKGASIMSVQVFSKFLRDSDCGGPGTAPCIMAYTGDIVAGLEQVYNIRTQHTVASVNLSLGGGQFTSTCDDEPEKAIIDNLRSAGVATVVAAGNNGWTNALSAPACISTAVSVGSTTKSDVLSSFSNTASLLSLLAPGSSIYSAVPGGNYGTASGTSMATPHVTGGFAVLRQAAPGTTVDELLGTLASTGVAITDTRTGGTVTKPRIRLSHALDALVTPLVSSVSPGSGAPGAALATVTITGANFVSGATVNIGAGVTVTSVAFNSATQLTLSITIAANAVAGRRDVTVTNPSGHSGTGTGLFMVSTTAQPIILDNAAPGVQDASRTFTGTWCQSTLSGYWGTSALFSCGAGLDSYRWTPQIAAAGSYDVYAWWTSYDNRSPTVVYTVTGAAGTTSVTVNQRAGGSQWQYLGRFTFNAGTTGWVSVDDRNNNGAAIADAVKLVPVNVAVPSLSITSLSSDKPSPQPAGTTVTFTATATGGTTPYQYKWWVYDGTTWTIARDWAPGNTFAWTPTAANANYQVRVWVRSIGNTTDAPEAQANMPYAIQASTAQPIILDNAAPGIQDASRTFTGTWCQSTLYGYWGTPALFSCGAGLDSYRWTPQIAAAGSYDVYAWWTSDDNRSPTVVYTVTGAAGTTPVTVNQRAGGSQWQYLGRFTFNAGTAGWVSVDDRNNNGAAIADALKLVPAF